jgi:hypothetical protein
MTDVKRFIGTNRSTWGGETTRRSWIGPFVVGTLAPWQSRRPHVQVIRSLRYVGINAFGFFASVSL